MPLLKGYAVLKGHAIRGVPAQVGQGHYSLHVVDDTKDYRIAINVRSNAEAFGTDLWFYLDEDFQHPVIEALKGLPTGMKRFAANAPAAERRLSGVALDIIRMNLFDRSKMKIYPAVLAGAHNDLNEQIDDLVAKSVGDEENLIYAFGEPWVDEQKKDKVFSFFPGNGVHDIHMNQGDLTGEHAQEDSVYQDGGLIFYYARENRYVAYFTKFQSQTWHTDDTTGHAINGNGDNLGAGGEPVAGSAGHGTHGGGNPIGPSQDPDYTLRIIAAMVNPVGPAAEAETVTLLNTQATPVDLSGWSLMDGRKQKMPLQGSIGKGQTLLVPVTAPMQLSNNGGLISLLDANGVKVHGVRYTAGQAHREGETIVFS